MSSSTTQQNDAPRTAINVVEHINTLPVSRFQVHVAILCALVAMLDGFDIQAIAFVAPSLSEIWQVPLSDFGPALAASLVGLMIGAMSLGPLGDKYGRKGLLIVSFCLVGLTTLLTAFATNMTELFIYRFLTGVGLGGTIPNAIALTAEYAPARRRTIFVTIMFCGFPLGAALGGFLAELLITQYGWQAIFYVGGVLPLLLCILLYFSLPESIVYLADRPSSRAETARLMAKIDRSFSASSETTFTSSDANAESGSIPALFNNGRWLITLLIWAIFFANLLLLYFILSWLPGILSASGLPRDRAFLATGIFNLGGVLGGISLSFICDRYGTSRVLVFVFLLAAVAIAAIATFFDTLQLVLFFVFFAGIGVVGSQFFLNVIAAAFYPTSIRSTGLGWALGAGRIGAIVAPLLGGVLMKWGWNATSIFWLLAGFAVLCVIIMRILHKKIESSSA